MTPGTLKARRPCRHVTPVSRSAGLLRPLSLTCRCVDTKRAHAACKHTSTRVHAKHTSTVSTHANWPCLTDRRDKESKGSYCVRAITSLSVDLRPVAVSCDIQLHVYTVLCVQHTSCFVCVCVCACVCLQAIHCVFLNTDRNAKQTDEVCEGRERRVQQRPGRGGGGRGGS